MTTARDRAQLAQLQASNPAVSAFVAASAGSGKTKLLTDGMSLGQAIQALRPSVDGSAEATHAETEADEMIRKTTTSTSTKTAQKKPVKPHHTGE